jgi:hypothetical protein
MNTAVTTDTDRLCAGHVNSAGQANQGDANATAISDLLDKKVTINTLREGTVSETCAVSTPAW